MTFSGTHCERSRNKPIEDGNRDEFIENSWGAAITDCLSVSYWKAECDKGLLDSNRDTSSQCCPSVTRDYANRADREQREVTLQFLDMAGLVDLSHVTRGGFIYHGAFLGTGELTRRLPLWRWSSHDEISIEDVETKQRGNGSVGKNEEDVASLF